MDGPITPLEFSGRYAWRSWLAAYHAEASEAWLVIQKKCSKLAGLSLAEAVEEAICYGWIDGKLLRLDGQRYLLRFSPRRTDSVWSVTNIRRVERLQQAGLMTDAGLAAVHAAKQSGEWQAALEREDTDKIPADLEAALRRAKGGLAAYRKLPNSQKKQFVYWLQSAKREQTKQKRLAEILRIVTAE
jgi:uncharacterized protein YdeI (YjbR/CyaY-like superfamily)